MEVASWKVLCIANVSRVQSEVTHGGLGYGIDKERGFLLLVSLPLVLGDRALDVQALPRLEVVHVLGHGAVGVLLDDEVNGALLVDIADGGVWADDGLLHLRALVLGDDSSC